MFNCACVFPFRFALIAMVITGSLLANEIHTELTVPWVPVTRLELSVNLQEGNLILSSGTEELIRGVFTHHSKEERPDFHYSSRGDEAEVEFKSRGYAEQWELYLTQRAMIDLQVQSRSGNQRLSLSDLTIRNFKLDSRYGNTVIDLGGKQAALESVFIRKHIGNLDFDLSGVYSQLAKVKIEMTTGEITVNLNGEWNSQSDIDVMLQNGNVSMTLPSNATVQIQTEVLGGEVVTSGLVSLGEGRFAQGLSTADEPALLIKIRNRNGNIFLQSG